ncbi:helix-turn-helix domain-containing protein [Winogradskyella flava]|uniref:AraC family transcriptional regulator n=1 Tax=Winogradskyella flava TaxID=1884876 RepID=A0A842IWC2_9FLAO|nr:helix-turn-helix domain-containing protein [Winogradskyella flava]MBC2846254.1 AraC family transcriptional regulator [Winogradskyella flava]
MDLQYNAFNILILFGAIQGIILCFFLRQKRTTNALAVDFFLLFLFSLSFFNLIYAFLDMDLFKYYRPLHVFPFPYKWLIGVGFYFYIKNQFPVTENEPPYHKKEWYLLAPAFIYMILRIYWFSIAVKEDSYRIVAVVVYSGFFRINEFFFLFFTFFMGVASLRFLKKNAHSIPSKSLLAFKWLKIFTLVFISISCIDILLYAIDLIINSGIETFGFYYATLLINAGFIYWIGFMGFTKSKLLFNTFKYSKDLSEISTSAISKKLKQAINVDKVYLNPNLTLSEMSVQFKVTPKELSKHINDVLGKNFSEYINAYRVEEVKALMASKEASKYTLVTLAEKAGFSSKSSFNETFKKVTGDTPSAYKKKIKGL